MEWKEILTIIIPILAMMGWFYNKIEKRLDRIDDKLQSIDSRVSRIEGQLSQLYHWEPKIKQKEE